MKEVIEQHKYIFETLWEKSIPALQKIREIEEGLQPDVIEISQIMVGQKKYIKVL